MFSDPYGYKIRIKNNVKQKVSNISTNINISQSLSFMKSVIFDHKSIKMDWGRNRPHPCAKGEFFVVTKIKILELSFIFKNNVYHERIKVKNNNDPRLIFA